AAPTPDRSVRATLRARLMSFAESRNGGEGSAHEWRTRGGEAASQSELERTTPPRRSSIPGNSVVEPVTLARERQEIVLRHLAACCDILRRKWIVNLRRRVLEVYRAPVASPAARFGWKYHRVRTLTPEATVSPLALPTATIAVADLLP